MRVRSRVTAQHPARRSASLLAQVPRLQVLGRRDVGGAARPGGPACKKAPPPAPARARPARAAGGRPRPLAARAPDAAPISCPARGRLRQPGGRPQGDGAAARTACTVLYEGFYWGATALSFAEKGPPRPVFHFLTGGPHSRTLVYDVEPAPAKEIEALIRSSKQVAVTIRRTRGDRSLVRMGVTGQSGSPTRPESREIGVLLQLVAHAPPEGPVVGPGRPDDRGARRLRERADRRLRAAVPDAARALHHHPLARQPSRPRRASRRSPAPRPRRCRRTSPTRPPPSKSPRPL